jgi:competence ComEA-like helix-hairpin-helix protein
MNLSKEKTPSRSSSSTSSLARLGPAHGYRFEGETVHLNAMFSVLDPAAHQCAWALQLWACPVAPTSSDAIKGHLISEVALPPMGEVADDSLNFEIAGPASLPAGTASHVLVLVLAAGKKGRFNEIHDYAAYPQSVQFVQPRLAGNVGFRIEGNRVQIQVERIENPRDAANLSGTVSLELWALPEPYRTGDFQGVALAGAVLDPLAGGFEYRHRSFDLPLQPIPAGTWHLVLMLREWTAAGYQTRDITNFQVPFTVPASPSAAPASPVTATTAKTAAVASPAVEAPVRATATPAPAPKSAAPTQSSKPTSSPSIEAETKAKAAPSAPAPSRVSVNSASPEELVAVTGLPSKVAENIVSKRPFQSLDDLAKVKGMGAKLLAKLRSKLRL